MDHTRKEYKGKQVASFPQITYYNDIGKDNTRK